MLRTNASGTSFKCDDRIKVALAQVPNHLDVSRLSDEQLLSLLRSGLSEVVSGENEVSTDDLRVELLL